MELPKFGSVWQDDCGTGVVTGIVAPHWSNLWMGRVYLLRRPGYVVTEQSVRRFRRRFVPAKDAREVTP